MAGAAATTPVVWPRQRRRWWKEGKRRWLPRPCRWGAPLFPPEQGSEGLAVVVMVVVDGKEAEELAWRNSNRRQPTYVPDVARVESGAVV